MLLVVVFIHASFLCESFSTITASKVLDTLVGLQVPAQMTYIIKLPTTKLARLLFEILLELKLGPSLFSDSTIIDFVSQGVFV